MRVLEDALLPLDQLLLDEAVQLVHSVVERVVETVVRRGFKLIFDELLVLECCPGSSFLQDSILNLFFSTYKSNCASQPSF